MTIFFGSFDQKITDFSVKNSFFFSTTLNTENFSKNRFSHYLRIASPPGMHEERRDSPGVPSESGDSHVRIRE